MTLPPVSEHFPPRVREWLTEAACTPNTSQDPFARCRAINRAIERAKALYPEMFTWPPQSDLA